MRDFKFREIHGVGWEVENFGVAKFIGGVATGLAVLYVVLVWVMPAMHAAFGG